MYAVSQERQRILKLKLSEHFIGDIKLNQKTLCAKCITLKLSGHVELNQDTISVEVVKREHLKYLWNS